MKEIQVSVFSNLLLYSFSALIVSYEHTSVYNIEIHVMSIAMSFLHFFHGKTILCALY